MKIAWVFLLLSCSLTHASKPPGLGVIKIKDGTIITEDFRGLRSQQHVPAIEKDDPFHLGSKCH